MTFLCIPDLWMVEDLLILDNQLTFPHYTENNLILLAHETIQRVRYVIAGIEVSAGSIPDGPNLTGGEEP